MKHFQQTKRKLSDSTISTGKLVLGIDPGFGRCGWAVLNKDLKSKITLIGCDCIETTKNKKIPERLLELIDSLDYLIDKYKPTELAIESLFWFKNQKTAMDVAQARGAIIAIAKRKGLEVFEYTPLQVKQSIVGYGRADKSQIIKMIKLHLQGQILPHQDDTADAVAIGLTHLQTVKY